MMLKKIKAHSFIAILVMSIIVLFTTNCNMDNKKEYIFEKDTILVHKAFPSLFVAPRDIEVFVPAGYTKKKKYNVLYMHDGKNVFNPETSTHKIDWGIDETMRKLFDDNSIKETIVVAIWSHPEYRYSEYMPQKPLPEMKSDSIIQGFNEEFGRAPYSDDYLKFLVTELKPFIDTTYSTKRGKNNTFIMGSSMGGLISAYAICEYPDIFGGAGCISTHWPILDGIFIKYLETNLPKASSHKIYFDFGTETLDAEYEPYQKKVDSIMMQNGYITEKNWMTLKFEGAAHDEKCWRERAHIPIQFLLNQ